jgi:hypothetical protein
MGRRTSWDSSPSRRGLGLYHPGVIGQLAGRGTARGTPFFFVGMPRESMEMVVKCYLARFETVAHPSFR